MGSAMLWVLTALLCLCLLALLVRWRGEGAAAQRRLVQCGAQLPGPPTLPLMGNIIDIGTDFNEFFTRAMKMWKDYGSLYRVWAGPLHLLVLLLDPRDIEILLTSKKNLSKPFLYNFLNPWLGLGLLTSTGKKWYDHRKIITPTFHFQILEQYLEVFNKHGDIFISVLKKRVEGEVFDIFPLVGLCTQDVIIESAMGVEMHAQIERYKLPYVKAVKGMCELICKRSTRPWLFPDFLYRLSSLQKEEKRNLEIIHGVTNDIIRRRKECFRDGERKLLPETEGVGMKKRLAFLDMLLDSEDKLSFDEIREEVDTIMFEGHETTASAISFALMELSKRPDIQEKIFEELKEASNGITKLSICMETLCKLKYLDQVIKETLRLYPSVPLFAREITEDVKLATLPVTLPPGTIVLICPKLLHQHPDHYMSPVPFNPDNFSAKANSRRNPFAYLPFSAGSRNCIGQKFAMLEIKTILAKIVWNFCLRIDPTFKLKLIPELTLKSLHGVKLSLTRRMHI